MYCKCSNQMDICMLCVFVCTLGCYEAVIDGFATLIFNSTKKYYIFGFFSFTPINTYFLLFSIFCCHRYYLRVLSVQNVYIQFWHFNCCYILGKRNQKNRRYSFDLFSFVTFILWVPSEERSIYSSFFKKSI